MQTAYVTTSRDKSAVLSFREVLRASSSSGSTQSETITGRGEMSLGRKRISELTINAPQGGSVQIREIGEVEYTREPPSARSGVPGHKAWVEVDTNKVDQAVYGKTAAQLAAISGEDPSGVIDSLEHVSNGVRSDRTTTLDGVRVHPYTASVNLDTVAARLGGRAAEAIRQQVSALGTHVLPVTVWIDAQHRLRQIQELAPLPPASSGATNGKGHATVTIRLLHFGVPVDVTAPPAAETANLTAPAIKAAKTALG